MAQLPQQDREAIIAQQRSVDVAKANAEAARVAVKQADEFQVAVEDEVLTAKTQQAEAENSVSYSKTKQAQNDLAAKRQVAAKQLAAAESKNEYANKLMEVREAEVEERDAEVELAQARYELSQYETLSQRGMAGGVDQKAIAERERLAEQKRAEAHQKVVQAQSYADVSKGNWEKSHAQYQSTAKSTNADDRPLQAPPPAKYLPAPPAK